MKEPTTVSLMLISQSSRSPFNGIVGKVNTINVNAEIIDFQKAFDATAASF